MKKIIALVLCLVMVFALCACGESNTATTAPAADTATEAPAEEPAAAGSVYYLNFKPESDKAWQALAETYTKQTGVPVTVAETGGCFEMPESYTGMCRLIDSGADFSAVFTLSDTMAISAMKALEDRGRRVPEDCSVIAIDGLTVSEYVSPTLTTLVQPAEEMGRESVRILLDILDNGGANRHVRLEAKIRPGASVKQL